VVMAGIAAAPWLTPRCNATPTIYDARKSMGWAVFFVGATVLTLSAIAVFLRVAVLEGVASLTPDKLPAWFNGLMAAGHAGIPDGVGRIPLAGITWRRDAVLFSLPVAAGLPVALQYLSLIGAIAASLAAAGATVVALATSVVEDGIGGSSVEPLPDAPRLLSARIAIVAIAATGMIMVALVRIDPLRHLTWALSLSAATAFPVVVLSIWWKRLNEIGALAALSTGFAITIVGIVLGEAGVLPLKGPLAGALGFTVATIVAFVVSNMTAPSSKTALELIMSMRIPGRETIYDREVRLSRLKRRQSGG
jgi:cation/acetate symporter